MNVPTRCHAQVCGVFVEMWLEGRVTTHTPTIDVISEPHFLSGSDGLQACGFAGTTTQTLQVRRRTILPVARSLSHSLRISEPPRHADHDIDSPAMMRNKPSSSMQKTYDDCYLMCSTAVYFEGQVRQSSQSYQGSTISVSGQQMCFSRIRCCSGQSRVTD